MNIEGKYTLQALPAEVWTRLMDQETLQRSVPGIEHLELLSSGLYAVQLRIGQTALVGSYEGQITISEHEYPHSYRMHIKGEGRESLFEGEGRIELKQQDNHTIVTYKGSLTIQKQGPQLSPTIVKGAIKLFIQQFFTTFSEQLRLARVENRAGRTAVNSMVELENSNGRIVLLPHAEEVTQELQVPPLLLRVVQKVGLGSGDPGEEARWTKRIKQAGFISSLLVLVWVGSRLPRSK